MSCANVLFKKEESLFVCDSCESEKGTSIFLWDVRKMKDCTQCEYEGSIELFLCIDCALKKKFFGDIIYCNGCDVQIGIFYSGIEYESKEPICQTCNYDFYDKNDLTEVLFLCQICRLEIG